VAVVASNERHALYIDSCNKTSKQSSMKRRYGFSELCPNGARSTKQGSFTKAKY
jgi:hypothetical protein